MSRTSILAVLGAGAFVAVPARAEAPPLRVDYEAAGGCPSGAVFLQEIQWRTSLARVAGPGEAALPVKARVARRGPTSSGRLVLGEGKDAITREVEGSSCDEVVSALALITALAVDPHARITPKEPPPAPLAAPLPAPPPALPSPSPVRAPKAVEALPPPQIVGDPLPAIPRPATARPLWALGARAVAAFAATPRPLLGGGVFAERVLSERWGASLGLSVEVAGTGGFGVGPGGAWFVRELARVEGCAFALRAVWFRLVPCAGFEGGAIEAGGILGGALAEVQQAAVPWFGGGVLPRAGADLGAVTIEAQGGPIFPAVRRTWSFRDPHYVIYELPPVTWTAGLEAGVRFP